MSPAPGGSSVAQLYLTVAVILYSSVVYFPPPLRSLYYIHLFVCWLFVIGNNYGMDFHEIRLKDWALAEVLTALWGAAAGPRAYNKGSWTCGCMYAILQ